MVYKGDLNDFMLLLASDSARLGGILGQVTRSLGAARDARLFTSRESEKKSAEKSIILHRARWVKRSARRTRQHSKRRWAWRRIMAHPSEPWSI